MNLRLKDLIAIAIATIASFPVLYLVMLFATGAARIEFGPEEKKPEDKAAVETMKVSARRDSLAAVNSRTYQALEQERRALEAERARLQEQQKRIDALQQELEAQRAALVQERGKLEAVVEKSDSLGAVKVRQLARMYAAMKPAEASQIIETLGDDMAARVLTAIGDDRQKARILALLSKDKAVRLSRIIGSRQ